MTSTYDTAFNCSSYYSLRRSLDENVIGIGVIEGEELYRIQKDIVLNIMTSGRKWKIFTNGGVADNKVAFQILNELGVEETKNVVVLPQNDEELIKTISQFSKVIAFRMHSLIIALAYGINVCGIEYDKKVRNMFKMIDAEECCFRLEEYSKAVQRLLSLEDPINLKKIREAAINSKKDLLSQINRFCR